MTYSTARTSDDNRSFFRCPVNVEKGSATLRVGRTKIQATVIDASIGGYTITLDAKYAKMLAKSRRDWLIIYDETKVRVRGESVSKPENGVVRVGLLQIEDLTKPEKISTSLWNRFKPTTDSSTAAVAYGGFVLLLFAAMALPGLGDQLGTSHRIQNTFRWLATSASQQVDMWTR